MNVQQEVCKSGTGFIGKRQEDVQGGQILAYYIVFAAPSVRKQVAHQESKCHIGVR